MLAFGPAGGNRTTDREDARALQLPRDRARLSQQPADQEGPTYDRARRRSSRRSPQLPSAVAHRGTLAEASTRQARHAGWLHGHDRLQHPVDHHRRDQEVDLQAEATADPHQGIRRSRLQRVGLPMRIGWVPGDRHPDRLRLLGANTDAEGLASAAVAQRERSVSVGAATVVAAVC